MTAGGIPIRLKAVKRNRLRRWLGALLLAPVLAFAVSASSFSALRCSITGMLVAESCCPSTAEGGPSAVPSRLDSIGDQDCCLRVVVAMDKIPAAGAEGGPALVASLPDPSPVRALHLADRRPPAGGALVTKPPGGPPVFLLTCSFLI